MQPSRIDGQAAARHERAKADERASAPIHFRGSAKLPPSCQQWDALGGIERRWWGRHPVNGAISVRPGPTPQPLVCGAPWTGGSQMKSRNTITVTIDVKFDVAATLWKLALVVFLLF
jgi:hypothetical protein